MAHVVEHLPNKHEVLNSNHSAEKRQQTLLNESVKHLYCITALGRMISTGL
jgi:hypothetical protein